MNPVVIATAISYFNAGPFVLWENICSSKGHGSKTGQSVPSTETKQLIWISGYDVDTESDDKDNDIGSKTAGTTAGDNNDAGYEPSRSDASIDNLDVASPVASPVASADDDTETEKESEVEESEVEESESEESVGSLVF